jgi:hypothetical protein
MKLYIDLEFEYIDCYSLIQIAFAAAAGVCDRLSKTDLSITLLR